MLSNLANEFGDGRPVSIATSFIERPQIMDSFMGLPGGIVNIANHKSIFAVLKRHQLTLIFSPEVGIRGGRNAE
jgi:hypothetical protein